MKYVIAHWNSPLQFQHNVLQLAICHLNSSMAALWKLRRTILYLTCSCLGCDESNIHREAYLFSNCQPKWQWFGTKCAGEKHGMCSTVGNCFPPEWNGEAEMNFSCVLHSWSSLATTIAIAIRRISAETQKPQRPEMVHENSYVYCKVSQWRWIVSGKSVSLRKQDSRCFNSGKKRGIKWRWYRWFCTMVKLIQTKACQMIMSVIVMIITVDSSSEDGWY